MNLSDLTILPLQRHIIGSTLQSFKIWLLLFIVITIAASICMIAGPLAFSHAIAGAATSSFTHSLMLFLTFSFCIGFTRFSQDIRLTITNRIEQGLRKNTGIIILLDMIKLHGSFFAENNPSKVLQMLQSFQTSNKMYVQLYLMVFVGGIIDLVISFTLIGTFVNWIIASCVIVYGVAIVVVTLVANGATSIFLRSAQVKANEGASLFGNIVSNIVSIKVFRAQTWVSEMYDTTYSHSRDAWNKFFEVRMRYGAIQATLLFIQYGAIFSVLLLAQTEENSTANVIAIGMILLQLNRPFELVGTSLRDLAMAKSMAQPLQSLFDTHRTEVCEFGELVQNPDLGPPEIQVKDLSFSYPGSRKFIFKNLTATFDSRHINFIIGPSGVGKSTLMLILLKLNNGYNGVVTVSNNDLKTISSDSYLQRVGYVAQDPLLMNMSIRDNVCFGRSYSDEEITGALSAANFMEKLNSLPDGLDYIVGERGQLLSGGERQRLAIARALIARPNILLLDEPSSSLDEEAERNIFKILRKVADETTIVAITHRIGNIEKQDTVLDLTDTSLKN